MIPRPRKPRRSPHPQAKPGKSRTHWDPPGLHIPPKNHPSIAYLWNTIPLSLLIAAILALAAAC